MTKPIKVIPHQDFKLTVYFENGKVSTIDMSFILQESGSVIDPLKSYELFQQVSIVDNIVTWPTGYDIDPEYLIELCN